MSINATFSERLQYIRTKRNLTQAQVADDLKVSRQSIGYYEKGDRIPDIETASKIAKYFNVSIDYLVGLENNISSENVNISEITGLSDEAIEVLKFIRNYKGVSWQTVSIDFINFIIEQETPPQIFDKSIFENMNDEESYKFINEKFDEWEKSYIPILIDIYKYFKIKNTYQRVFIGEYGEISLEEEITIDDLGGIKVNGKSMQDGFLTKHVNAKKINQKDITDNILLYEIQDQLKKAKGLYIKKQGESDGEYT